MRGKIGFETAWAKAVFSFSLPFDRGAKLAPTAAEVAPAVRDTRALKVLLVATLTRIARLPRPFKDTPYHVDEASSSAQAIALFKTTRYDISWTFRCRTSTGWSLRLKIENGKPKTDSKARAGADAHSRRRGSQCLAAGCSLISKPIRKRGCSRPSSRSEIPSAPVDN